MRYIFCFLPAIFLALPSHLWSQTTTINFNSTSQVDLGSNLEKLADLDDWSYTLGTDWNEPFSIGGIIGAPNTTIIPEVKVLGETIIPRVAADTRTGARMQGRVTGDVGLEFSAAFNASGLEPGVGFDFRPTLKYDKPETGAFFSFSTDTGLQSNSSFTEDALELPSVDAQVDFFFNLGLSTSVDYGLFPFIPYNSAPFRPGGIHLDQRGDADKSLVRFQASLDPDDNGGAPLPPRLTFLDGVELFGQPIETQVGLLDDGQFLANKQISFSLENEDDPKGPKPRIDVGEVQVLNPFGTGGDLLQGNNDRNLKIGTSVSQNTIGYQAETPLFRLGLDLDGLAAGLAVGHSFTRVEEDIKIGKTKVAEIMADFIDLKYGPEVGFRESVEITPDFNVRIDFRDAETKEPVAVALNDNGNVSLSDSAIGKWTDLPEIALLDSTAVEVSVSFEDVTGEQSKRGAMYLSDYLEFTLFELESLKVFDIAELSLPPVFRTRTSLLGDLLGEVELEAYRDSQTIQPFALEGQIPSQTFTIKPTPPMYAYLVEGGEYNPDRSTARRLSDHVKASHQQLDDLTLAIGIGNESSRSVADFTPVTATDNGHMIDLESWLHETNQLSGDSFPAKSETVPDAKQKRKVMGLQIIEGSTYEQSGARTWETATIRNDGLYRSVGDMTRFSNPDGTMVISGSGAIEFEERGRIDAAIVVHGEGHTLRFDSATGFATAPGDRKDILIEYGSSSPPEVISIRLPDRVIDGSRLFDIDKTLVNSGVIAFHESEGDVFAGMEIANAASGQISLSNDSPKDVKLLQFTTPQIVNNGRVSVNAGTQLVTRHPNSNSPVQLRGDGSFVVDGGKTLFQGNLVGYAPDDALLATANAQTFDVMNGGSLTFGGVASFFAKPTFNVGEGSELTFNGLALDGTRVPDSKFRDGSPIEIVNDGHVIFNSGSNSLEVSRLVLAGQNEPKVVPIGLDNRGTVTVQNTARLSFAAEIRDYTEGGATFDAGTWEVIGPTPAAGTRYSNRTSDDSNVARVNMKVSQIEQGDNFLSVIDPGQAGGAIGGFVVGYDATEYDTFMAVNKSDITLSGRAKFEYLNSIKTNAGRLALANRNQFETDGPLTNSGVIEVTGGSRLAVNGDLFVDGGSVFIERGSSLSVGNNTIEIQGGTVEVEVAAPSLTIQSDWNVREQVILDEEGNVAEVIPGIVDYGDTTFPTIGPASEITIAGVTAEYRPLRALNRIQGKLSLEGGNVLSLNQSLRTDSGSELNVTGGANLLVAGAMNHHGNLTVGEDSYAQVDGSFTAQANSIFTVDGVSRIFGDFEISSGATSRFVVDNDDEQARLSVNSASLAGSLEVVFHSDFDPALDSLVKLIGLNAGSTESILGEFDNIDLPATQTGKAFELSILEDGVFLDPYLLADFNNDGQRDGTDIDLLSTVVRLGTFGERFDLNSDGLVDESDRVVLVEGFEQTFFGDADLDGVVAFADFLTLSDNFGDAGGWSEGDFDGNEQIEFPDFLLLSENFGQSHSSASSVPEPSGLAILLPLLSLILFRNKRRLADFDSVTFNPTP